ncbi:MAG: hypothetical protein KAW92_14360, partial [Candidatus Cloacimonetes bacterium]|nr:hypothetical protein [Candidatus Cloacimonadota bacterium]
MTKNSLIGFILIVLFSTNLFGQFNQPGMKFYPIETEIKNTYTRYDTIPAPEWEFITFPAELMTSYYDYMPGGYKAHPIKKLSGFDETNYFVFHARSSTTNNRRVYLAYVSPISISFETITNYDNWQGFPSIELPTINDNYDPIMIWHEDFDYDGYSETPITYYTMFPLPPIFPIENPDSLGNEFIWPLLYISDSPLGYDYNRVHVLRTNCRYNSSGNSCPNVQILYKDIQYLEEVTNPGWLDNQITNENGDPIFTDWCEQDIIPYWSFAVDEQVPGRIAFIGYMDYPVWPWPEPDMFFVYESLDYGETWTLYDFGMPPAIENLLQLEDNQGNVLDSIEVGIIGFHNTALFDGEGNLHWCYTGSYGYTDDEENWNYFDHFIHACEFVWFGDDIVEWRNVWPPVPWEIDPETGDTLVHESAAYNMYPGDANLFHENTQKQAVNLENNWMIQVWADGTYQMFAEDGDTTYLDYLEHPIIFVSATKDNGVHWTEPIELTDIYSVEFPDFADQITVYPYICDQIVDLGDGWGQVYMDYLDDNSFGSSIFNQGEYNGGQITYCSFKINFD